MFWGCLNPKTSSLSDCSESLKICFYCFVITDWFRITVRTYYAEYYRMILNKLAKFYGVIELLYMRNFVVKSMGGMKRKNHWGCGSPISRSLGSRPEGTGSNVISGKRSPWTLKASGGCKIYRGFNILQVCI